MSTGKRLAKRSIVGTRVCAKGDDGKYYSGVIQAVKTPSTFPENNNCINLTPNTRYSVRFDARHLNAAGNNTEFLSGDLIGPGFRSVLDIHLAPGQKAFVTYKGREVSGEVQKHHLNNDEVTINIYPPGNEGKIQLHKKLEEVRLLESRKSARLADQDTDFARLADMASERKRNASNTIDVPNPLIHWGSRKRRPSSSQDEAGTKDPQLDECSAALVLMSLSCSPHSPNFSNMSWSGTSPGSSSSGSSWRLSPSPPPRETSPTATLSTSSASDEGIEMDYPDELPRKKPARRIVFQCTWPGCRVRVPDCSAIEAHVRDDHLKSRNEEISENEEEFYYNEVELEQTSPPPTLSHMDMARPPHEDPEYQRQIVGTFRQFLTGPMPIPQSPHKLLKLSPRPHSPKTPLSPRRARGENKKCRKVYGMDHREQWCTQCKWKKACTRFGD